VTAEQIQQGRIVIEHVGPPWFGLTVTLTSRGDKTHLAWDQELESPEVAATFRPLCATANERNLDRLPSLLASESDRGRRWPINSRRVKPSNSAQERRKVLMASSRPVVGISPVS
jgi:hypothetical protein